jgi:nucleotide-binding universal stress UspA family protein
MFDKVLFATDFSDYSKKTLECISGIPGIGHVLLLHVFDATHLSIKGWVYDPAIEKAKEELEKQARDLTSQGVRSGAYVEVITSGDVAGAVVDVAKREGVSLIIMGARGRGIIRSVLLGSVSRKVLRVAESHVLIMRHRLVESLDGERYELFCPRILSHVLYPTDFSQPSAEVATILKNLGKVEKVILLNVVSRGETEEEIATHVGEAERCLETIAKDFRKAGMEVRIVVKVGGPTDEINRLAEEEDVSLIAMGRHGSGWMKELLVGSTVYMVTKRAKRPVLVVQSRMVPDGE